LKDEVIDLVEISIEPNAKQKDNLKWSHWLRVGGGLVAKCTHVLVFSSDAQREAFNTLYQTTFATGLLMAGGTNPILRRSIQCMQTGSPLFVFKGTGGTSEQAASLLEFHKKAFEGEVKLSGSEADALAREMFSHVAQSTTRMGDSLALQSALDFPETFNPQAALLIDLNKDGRVQVEKLQDDITKVMASVYDHVQELGGADAEKKALVHAHRMMTLLAKAAWRHRSQSTMLMIIMRTLIFTTTLLTLVSTHLKSEDSLSSDAESLIKAILVILPLVIGVISSFYATNRPIQKFAALFASSKRIEGEMFRYRARIGEYKAAMGGHPREKFADNCKKIFGQCADGDMRLGAFTRVHEIGLNRQIFAKVDEHDESVPEGVLSADRYIETRLNKALWKNDEIVPGLTLKLSGFQIAIVVVTAATAALSAFDLELWVPGLLAAAGVAESAVAYQQFETRIPSINAGSSSLTVLLLWWDGLSLIQQRIPANKQLLVDTAETALLIQYEAYVQGALSNLEDLKKAGAAAEEGNQAGPADGDVEMTKNPGVTA